MTAKAYTDDEIKVLLVDGIVDELIYERFKGAIALLKIEAEKVLAGGSSGAMRVVAGDKIVHPERKLTEIIQYYKNNGAWKE